MATKPHSFKRNCLALGIAAAISMTGSLSAAEADSFEINIEKSSAGKALLELAEKSGAQIVFSQEVGSNIILPGLKGEYTLSVALDEILRGSGLVYEFLSDDSVVIKKNPDTENEPADEVSEEVIVTGSLLRKVNPVTPIVNLTREDFDKIGARSLEDVMRSLPQNFSSTNSTSSTDDSNEALGEFLNPELQGTSLANLRGLGGTSTLVLVNGRRRAGAGVTQGDAFDISTIPLAAVERVEVLLDGASAIYGADAIGGVINVILKKDDYTTATTSVNYSNVGNGGDEYSLSQYFNYSWDSGRLSATLSHEETDAVTSVKVGNTTSNLAAEGGTDWLSTLGGLVGIPTDTGYVRTLFFQPLGGLPNSFDGSEAWTAADLSQMSSTVEYFNRKDVTPESKKQAMSLDFEQELTEKLSVFADLLYSTNESYSRRLTPNHQLFDGIVLPTNAFNRLGQPLRVAYVYNREVEAGLIPATENYFSEKEAITANIGFNWDLPFKDWRLTAVATHSEDNSDSHKIGIQVDTPEFISLLNSSDPAVALNLFGNGTLQTPQLSSLWGKTQAASSDTEMQSINLKLEGGLLDLPGGEVRGALGYEFREETVVAQSPFAVLPRGLDEAEREVSAWFMQVNIPLVGSENELPLVKFLSLDLAVRQEEYDVNTPVAGGTFKPSFSNTSPKIGLAWKPFDTLTIRSTLSEAFIVPNFLNLLRAPTGAFTQPVFDWLNNEIVLVPNFFGGNPNLKPQTSDNLTVGFDWMPDVIEGFSLSVTFNDTEFKDRVTRFLGSPGTTNAITGPVIFANPQIAVRDDPNDPTRLTAFNAFPLNIAARNMKAIDFDVNYDMDTDNGLFSIGLAGTYVSELEDIVIAGAAPSELVGTFNGPSEWVGRFSLGWDRENRGVNLNVNYSSSYNNNGSTIYGLSSQSVEHWSTIDVSGYYELENGIRVNGGIRNLLDNRFPLLDSPIRNFDASRVDPRGRIVYVSATKSFDF